MRTFAVTLRILRQFKRDKRTLALVLVAPNLILALLALIFNGDSYQPTLASINLGDRTVQFLEDEGATVVRMESEGAESALASNEVDAIIRLKGGRIRVQLEGSDPTKAGAVRLALMSALQNSTPSGGLGIGSSLNLRPEFTWLHGSEDMAAFDNFGPVLLGFFIFFFTFIISGVAFVRERTTGTLERMMTTPLGRVELVLGYTLAFAVVVFLQATLVAAVAVKLLGMMLVGSFFWLLVICLLLAATAMTLGMFISAFATSEFQVFQFIPLVIVPQVFFSGLFPLESMAPWLRGIGKALPLTYGADTMRAVMIRGTEGSAITTDLVVLAGFVGVFLVANVIALKRYRSI